MVPTSLSVWIQRAGRAGRTGSPSCAVLLYEPSVTKRLNTQTTQGDNEDDPDDECDQEWTGEDFKKRNVEDSLRSYVLTNKCRWLLTDAYFDNPPRNARGTVFVDCQSNADSMFTEYTVPCCDNCVNNENPQEPTSVVDLLNMVLGTDLAAPTHPVTTQDKGEGNADNRGSTPILPADGNTAGETNGVGSGGDNTTNDPGETIDSAQSKKPGSHRAQQLADCRDFLTKWRYSCWKRDHNHGLWGPSTILLDSLVTKFASSGWVKSVEDVRREFDGWLWIDEYSVEVLEGLASID